MVIRKTHSATAAPSLAAKSGFVHWMRRVLSEHSRAMHGLDPDTVHDLRVALRRCRSMADGFMEVDFDPAWRDMKKSGRKLFRRLGELRDVQVMMDWVQKLEPPGDLVAKNLLASLHQREWHLKRQTAADLSEFDRGKWKTWAKHLGGRTTRLAPNSAVFQHIALQRWQKAYDLHRRALRNRSQKSWHQLRIGIKRFRYTVENFLPSAHSTWVKDLKRMQDLLGDVHDLDMLWAALRKRGIVFDSAERSRWHEIISLQRQTCLAAYRELVSGGTTSTQKPGSESIWNVWRLGLPQGEELESSGLQKLRAWASFLDPQFGHTRHVARLALNLFDGMAAAKMPGPYRDLRNRLLLHAAALMHNVGRTAGHKGHHKQSYRLIRQLKPPMGWSDDEFEVAALIARYHRGSWPRAQHKGFSQLPPIRRETVLHLGGILRLAAAFDHAHTHAVRALHVRVEAGALHIWAEGYRQSAANTRILAAERHLLERALRIPVLIRPRPEGPRQLQFEESAIQVA